MSYDLYLLARSGQLDQAAFSDYFGNRNGYRLHGGQAWYENEDTGVYFSFDLPDEEDAEELDEEVPRYACAFNMNLSRPGFFALEAARELRTVTEELRFDMFDPQTGSRSGFDEQRFVESWNHSNQKATAVLRHAQPEMATYHLPRWTLDATWTWNYHRA